MKKYLAVVLVVACGKSAKAPPPAPKDAGTPIDAAVAQAIDAPAAPKKPVPTKVVVSLHASCAVMSDETLRCWGQNMQGQLGDGTTSDHPTPVTPAVKGVLDIAMGAADACALLDDGSVACWGDIGYGKNDHLALPTGVPGVNDAKHIFAVGAAACATMTNGAFVCWGDIDSKGHLRLAGGTREHRVPTPGEDLAYVTALTASGALRDDGSVWTWSADGAPKKTSLENVTEIAAAGDGICGLTPDGEVKCTAGVVHCGAEPAPRRGKPKRGKKGASRAKLAPEPPPGELEKLALPKASHLAFDVGLCVVTTTGHLQCLQVTNPCEMDAPWPGLEKVAYVDGHCARSTDGSVRCWRVDRKSRTVSTINGVAGAVQMASSASHGCALLATKQLVCWGENTHGELGRGSADTAAHSEAAPVAL